MTEIRLAIIFAFVVVFWAWVFAIYITMQGDLVMSIVGITALIPVTLMFCMKAREDWNS